MSAAPTADTAATAQKQSTLTKNQKKKLKKKLKKAAAHEKAEDTVPNSTEHAAEGEEGVVMNHQDTEKMAKGLPQNLANQERPFWF